MPLHILHQSPNITVSIIYHTWNSYRVLARLTDTMLVNIYHTVLKYCAIPPY